MFELIKVTDKTYYINYPTKIGIHITDGNEVYIIDSGNDKMAGKRILRVLDENGWKLKGIINTHSHADHIGGNHYLQENTGCKIFANGTEAACTKYTILEPSLLYGGCPCDDLRHKFFLAQESEACDITDEAFPEGFEIVDLSGHAFNMIGIRTPDNVLFMGDCVSSNEILEKYRVTYIYDVEGFLKSLDKAEQLTAELFVPSHTQAVKDMKELVEINRKAIASIIDDILEFLKDGLVFDQLLKRIFDKYELRMNFQQHELIGSTLRSYLTYLKQQGKITAEFKENLLIWKTV
ncbi:MAG: MBL fold metallo-hydrolase [Clostridiales bacterium]|nr:MBL fold metallo-hydrolase [Clostridiales bacterium]